MINRTRWFIFQFLYLGPRDLETVHPEDVGSEIGTVRGWSTISHYAECISKSTMTALFPLCVVCSSACVCKNVIVLLPEPVEAPFTTGMARADSKSGGHCWTTPSTSTSALQQKCCKDWLYSPENMRKFDSPKRKLPHFEGLFKFWVDRLSHFTPAMYFGCTKTNRADIDEQGFVVGRSQN